MNATTTTPEKSPAATAAPAAAPASDSKRLMSVDVLRGFDMFWIVGAGSLFYALSQMQAAPKDGGFSLTKFLATQFQHVYWEGFRFYDLIFPMFIFIVGVSLVFSLTKTLAQRGRASAVKRIFVRALLLIVLGIIYNGGLAGTWQTTRLVGVLERIGISYLAAGLIFCFFRTRTMVAICVGLLVGYWAILTFVPIRDISLEAGNLKKLMKTTGVSDVRTLYDQTTNYVSGSYAKGLNVANHFDFLYLPGGKAYGDQFDPEGLLGTLPSIATCLLGVFAGLLLRNNSVPDKRKVILLIAAGVAAVSLGWIWNLQFPVIKRIWTSSYVLVAGGYSAIFLGVFYLIIDVWKFRKWCQPFLWLGMNSITIYMASNIIDFRKLAERFTGGGIKDSLNEHLLKGTGDLLVTLTGLLLIFLLARFLHRRNIFLRL
jgi:predicted acyltransferase